jgi:hypothetical protein
MNPMAGGKRPSLNGMFGLAAIAFLMWVIPVTQPVLIPLIYLNTHIHEFCHAIIALATGGSVQYIKVFTNGSGVTPVSGGSLLLIASAGYVGSAISGGWLVACCRSEKNAKNALIGLGGMMVLSMVVFVRGDLVGLLSGAAWAAVLLWAGLKAKGELQTGLVAFLGFQGCLTAGWALLNLLQITTSMSVNNDAEIMESITRIPAVAWAISWCILSIIAIAAGWKTALKSK